MKVKTAIWLCVTFFFCGGLVATLAADARETVDASRTTQQLRQQVDEYRNKCIDWSHYVYQLENESYNDDYTGE